MKKRAITKTSPRQSSMTSRRRRSALPSASRKSTARVSAGKAGSRTGRRRRVGEAAGKTKLRAAGKGRFNKLVSRKK